MTTPKFKIETKTGVCGIEFQGITSHLHWTLYFSPLAEQPLRRVLFHHGWTGSALAFRDAASFLASTGRFACLTFSARATGLSSRPQGDGAYAMPHYLADILGLADAVWGAGSRFIYAGHSMGGLIGYQLGLLHAPRLEQLVLVAPAPASGLRFPEEFFAPSFERWRRAKQGDAEALREMVDDAVTSLPLEGGARGAEEVAAEVRFWVEVGLFAAEEHYRGSWKMMTAFQCHEQLHALAVPALLVCGSADNLLSFNLKDYKEIRKVATLHVFSGCGHSPQREKAAEFNAVLLHFLDHGPSNWATIVQKFKSKL